MWKPSSYSWNAKLQHQTPDAITFKRTKWCNTVHNYFTHEQKDLLLISRALSYKDIPSDTYANHLTKQDCALQLYVTIFWTSCLVQINRFWKSIGYGLKRYFINFYSLTLNPLGYHRLNKNYLIPSFFFFISLFILLICSTVPGRVPRAKTQLSLMLVY